MGIFAVLYVIVFGLVYASWFFRCCSFGWGLLWRLQSLSPVVKCGISSYVSSHRQCVRKVSVSQESFPQGAEGSRIGGRRVETRRWFRSFAEILRFERAALHLDIHTPAATYLDTNTSTAPQIGSSAPAHLQPQCHNTSGGYAIPIAPNTTLSI